MGSFCQRQLFELPRLYDGDQHRQYYYRLYFVAYPCAWDLVFVYGQG